MGFLDRGGTAADAFGSGFFDTYFAMQKNERAKEEALRAAANDEIINKLRNQQLMEAQKKQAADELFKKQYGDTMVANNPTIGVTPAIPQQGQFDINRVFPQNTLEQYVTGLVGQVPNSPMQTQQPFIAGQPEQVDQQTIANLRQGQFPQGVQGKQPSLDQWLQMLILKDPEKGAAIAASLAARDHKETWGEPYNISLGNKKATVQRSSLGQVRQVLQDGTTVNMQMPAKEDVEVMAQMLAEGKINTTDISKRGGNQQLAAILRRAKEINPNIDPRANMADTSGYASAINFQQKQLGSMGSFVKNMDMQVDKVEKLANDLKTFDSRILNLPLRAWRGKIAGSKEQAKYDMYLTEIENEIGKLASGSSASISELSVGAQKKWANIHDKNLSAKDMISLLRETAQAGKLRMKSVEDQLKETREQMRSRGGQENIPTETKSPPQAAIDYLKKNPKQAIFFDQKYGRGASQRILGGQ